MYQTNTRTHRAQSVHLEKKPTVFSAYFIFFCLIFERQSLRYESVHICCCSNSFSFFVHPSVHGMRMHILILFLLDVLLKLHSAYRTKKNLARNRHKNNSISIPATSYTKYDLFQEKNCSDPFDFAYIFTSFFFGSRYKFAVHLYTALVFYRVLVLRILYFFLIFIKTFASH